MNYYLYLSLIPEALIGSMLPPHEFGMYFAVGTRKRTRGEAIFFHVDSSFKSKDFPFDSLEKRCVPNSNGDPKRSVYLSIYRALEHVPVRYLKELYLVTDDGRVLEIGQSEYKVKPVQELHLYQELSPVNPLIASNLDPITFCRTITNKNHVVHVPKVVFVELLLGGLAENPKQASAYNLPYKNLDHLRDCLNSLLEKPDKPTKTVIRSMPCDLLYRTIKNGFFVGDAHDVAFYPFPSIDELEEKNHDWWRSANVIGFQD
ncbi:MAG: hypothetical protein EHM72_11935 [Calditrichaeota bacterium]|nr:MAG: hypothetical protein EHM72_11935 [Calditrichota bacterium]